MDTLHSTRRFYVYVLARPNGKPFYVGKGSGTRILDHEAEARGKHDCYKCRVIRKIWREGSDIQRTIVFETDNEQEAFAYEIDLIATYGRKTLTNMTDGGEGVSNPDPKATAKRIRAYRKTVRARISASVRQAIKEHKLLQAVGTPIQHDKRRRNGKGCIHRREDGRWCASVTVGMRNSRQHRKYFYATSRTKVMAKLKAFLASQE